MNYDEVQSTEDAMREIRAEILSVPNDKRSDAALAIIATELQGIRMLLGHLLARKSVKSDPDQGHSA